MIVYRVQDVGGNGAYYGGLGCEATNVLDPDEWALAQRAGPMGDYKRMLKACNAHRIDFWTWLHSWRFAFPTVEAAYRWFPPRAMAILAQRGFFLQAVEADVVLLSDSGEQCIYRQLPPEPDAGDVRGIA